MANSCANCVGVTQCFTPTTWREISGTVLVAPPTASRDKCPNNSTSDQRLPIYATRHARSNDTGSIIPTVTGRGKRNSITSANTPTTTTILRWLRRLAS